LLTDVCRQTRDEQGLRTKCGVALLQALSLRGPESNQTTADPFQIVKAVVRDATRFLDRAESLLANRRRNVGWTTWYFQRRLEAIALSVWASILDEGAPVPFLGLSAAPEHTDTVADDALHQSLRIIRLDTYRLATIVDAYASCAHALHVRLLCDRKVPRLIERQEKMCKELETAVEFLKAMGRERTEAANKAADTSRRQGSERDKLTKPTEMDKATRDYIGGNQEENASPKKIGGVIQRTERLIQILRHPVR